MQRKFLQFFWGLQNIKVFRPGETKHQSVSQSLVLSIVHYNIVTTSYFPCGRNIIIIIAVQQLSDALDMGPICPELPLTPNVSKNNEIAILALG